MKIYAISSTRDRTKPDTSTFFAHHPFSLPYAQESRSRVEDFNVWTIWLYPNTTNPTLCGHEIYKFLAYNYYKPSMYDPCPGVDKRIFKGAMHFHEGHETTTRLSLLYTQIVWSMSRSTEETF